MKKFSAKRALLLSVLSMVICVSMLIGSTFAWFTDSATANVNTIQSGNLDVDLQVKNAGGEWVSADGTTLNFVKLADHEDEAILWEPGCTYNLPELRVVNNGNLALKYQLVITGATGDTMLLDVIKFKAVVTPEGGEAVTSDNAYGTTLISDGELLAGKYATLNISAHMDETAGNDYRDKAVSGIAIKVVATQLAHEYDSNGNQYDKYAQYGERTVKDASSLKDATNENVYTTNITYSFQAKNYEAGFFAQKFGVNSTFDGNGATFSGNFELNGGYVPTDNQESTLVVSNINVEGDLIVTAAGNNVIINNCTAKHISVLGPKDGVSVTIDNCKITGTLVDQVRGNNKYGIYITGVNDAEVEVNILNSSISGVASHAISVNGSGAAFTFNIKGNHFGSYGLNGDSNRAAFKIWGDKTLGPNNSDPINDAAIALAESVKEDNTFASDLGTNCVVAEFYANTVVFN